MASLQAALARATPVTLELLPFLPRKGSSSASTREESCDSAPSAERTSVTFRNLPTCFTGDALARLLDEHGFAGEYGMIYVPMDRRHGKSRGFGFVNFDAASAALQCKEYFEGFSSWDARSTKVCRMEWSECQGDAHHQVLAYGNGAILREDLPENCKPALFRNGVRVAYCPELF